MVLPQYLVDPTLHLHPFMMAEVGDLGLQQTQCFTLHTYLATQLDSNAVQWTVIVLWVVNRIKQMHWKRINALSWTGKYDQNLIWLE